MQKPFLIDVTLRDGDQSPGVAFDAQDKTAIAQMLDRVGIYQIEAGIPAMGEIEQKAIREVAALDLSCKVSTWNRMMVGDILSSIACGIQNLHLCVPVSDIHLSYKLGKSRSWILKKMEECISFARDAGCRVTVGTEDASRAEEGFLTEVMIAAHDLGADRLRYSDTVGVLNPFSTFEAISRLREKVKAEIEFHGHNDFGMATANALAAWAAGCSFINVTVCGLGERAGNTSLEEFIRALQGLYGIDCSCDPQDLEKLTAYVSRAANRTSGNKLSPGSNNLSLLRSKERSVV